MSCPHNLVSTDTVFTRLTDEEGGEATSFSVKLNLSCVDCGEAFTWLGVETFPSPTRPWVSVDGHTLHVTVALALERPSPLDEVFAAIAAKLGGL